MAELAERERDFQKKNANLAVIGSGEPRYFAEFRQATGYEGELLTDPERNAFALLGFASGVGGLMSIRSLAKAFSAKKEGHSQGGIQGSTLQLGGAVIIAPYDDSPADSPDDVSIDSQGASLRYYYAGRKAGDHPKVADLLAALGD